MMNILSVKNLTVSFKTKSQLVKAVRGISFDLHENETLAIVGESGSGKSATSKALVRILESNAIIESGAILFEGKDLLSLSDQSMNAIRGSQIAMVFQDTMSTLDPVIRVGKQIEEAIKIRNRQNKKRAKVSYQSYLSLKKEKADFTVALQKKHEELVKHLSLLLEGEEEDVLKFALQARKLSYPYFAFDEVYHEKIDEIINAYHQKEKDSKKVKEREKIYQKYHLSNKDYYALPLAEKARLEEREPSLETDNKELQLRYLSLISLMQNEIQQELDYEKLSKLLEEKAESDKDILNHKESDEEIKQETIALLAEVGIEDPELVYSHYPFELSGGMRQRIVIAIALSSSPKILICDEPTTALDVTIQNQILALIEKLKKERNLSVIFITHDLGVVSKVADRVLVMYGGKILEEGDIYEIFFDPRHPYTWALLSSVPELGNKGELYSIAGSSPDMLLPPKGDPFARRNPYALKQDLMEMAPFTYVSKTHKAATFLLDENAPDVTPPEILIKRLEKAIKKDPGKIPQPTNQKNSILPFLNLDHSSFEKEEMYKANISDKPLLEVKGLSKSFDGNRHYAVKNVSFFVKEGEALGLVGESGSGKTTTSRMINALYELSSGEIYFQDKLIRYASSNKESFSKQKEKEAKANFEEILQRGKDGIQMVFQDPIASLDPRMTIRDIIQEGLIVQGIKDENTLSSRVKKALAEVNLPENVLDRYPNEFSGGQRQRVGIARAIIMEPKLLLADEPVSSLDVSVQASIINLLSKLKKEKDLSVLFVAHNLSVVRNFCDRIAVMYQGRIVEMAPTETLFKNPLHPYTRRLLSSIPEPDPIVEKKKDSQKLQDIILVEDGQLYEVEENHFLYQVKENEK